MSVWCLLLSSSCTVGGLELFTVNSCLQHLKMTLWERWHWTKQCRVISSIHWAKPVTLHSLLIHWYMNFYSWALFRMITLVEDRQFKIHKNKFGDLLVQFIRCAIAYLFMPCFFGFFWQPVHLLLHSWLLCNLAIWCIILFDYIICCDSASVPAILTAVKIWDGIWKVPSMLLKFGESKFLYKFNKMKLKLRLQHFQLEQ